MHVSIERFLPETSSFLPECRAADRSTKTGHNGGASEDAD